jgi:tRNA/rRNA methyltransferase
MTSEKIKFENISIVLVEPKVPGNVGASARAIKNMGLSSLVLVNPWFLNHPQSRYMAHGSEDIINNAVITDDLKKAVADSVLVVGTTQRKRTGSPFMNPKQAVQEILESSYSGPVSILFGREDRGLLNDELKMCHILVTIPSSKAQPSLNLSQAVMVMAYEIYSSVYPGVSSPMDLSPAVETDMLYEHLNCSLAKLGFKQWNDGDNYMKSLRRVFSRTKLERRDVATIHKLCGEIDRYAARVSAESEDKNK